MSGKKKKFHEKEAEEEKKSTAQEAEVVHTDPVIQYQTEASHVEEQPQAQVHMQDQRASQMHPQEQSQQSSQIHTQEQPEYKYSYTLTRWMPKIKIYCIDSGGYSTMMLAEEY